MFKNFNKDIILKKFVVYLHYYVIILDIPSDYNQ